MNGYSGYLPPGYRSRKERLSGLLDSRDVAELASLGVTHVLVHRDQIEGRQKRRQFARWLEEIELNSGPPLRVVRTAEDSVVLEIDQTGSNPEELAPQKVF